MQSRRWQLAIPLFLTAALLTSFDFDGYGRLRGSVAIWIAVAALLVVALYLWHGKRTRDWIATHARRRRRARSPSLAEDEGLALYRCLQDSQRARDSIREARDAVDQAQRDADHRDGRRLEKAKGRLEWLDDWMGETIKGMQVEERELLER